MDDSYSQHPKRFRHGRPVTKRPPVEVAINADDGITVDAETLMKNGGLAPSVSETVADIMNYEKCI